MVRDFGDNESMKGVEYSVLPHHESLQIASSNGFELDSFERPKECGHYGIDVLGDEYHKVFCGTAPALWRFIKC